MLITICFSFSEDDAPNFIHRIRNFADDLERRLYEVQIGHVLNMDTATTEVKVSAKSKKHLGDISKIIKTCLTKHKLLDIAKF